MIHLYGENRITFMTKLAQIYKEVSPPDYSEVLREYEYFQTDGSVKKYSRMFEWKETLGADVIFTSTVSSYSCNYTINTSNDWLLVFSVKEYLMTLDPFDYVEISAENYNGQLPDKVTGQSIVIIPAFMLHYILQKEETAQLLESISMYADLGLTVATLGSYTAGKTVLMLGRQVAIATVLDFTIQAGIKTLGKIPFIQAVYEINPRDALWTGVSTLIDHPKMSVALSCFRNNLNIILGSSDKTLDERIIEWAGDCIGDILLSLFTNKLIGSGSKYHGLLIAVFLEAPEEATLKLLRMGFDPAYILSLTEVITNNAIKSLITQTIENYEE